MEKTFNLIITGVGGQGIVTLLSVINEAAFLEGYDIKSSELHGLSQREGSVEAHARFGKKVFSPLIPKHDADLILGLEILESLRAVIHAGKKTKILSDTYYLPFDGSPKKEEIEQVFGRISGNVQMVQAHKECKEKLQNEVLGGVFLLGYAIKNNLIPIKKEVAVQAIKNVIPEKYQEINIKALELSHG